MGHLFQVDMPICRDTVAHVLQADMSICRDTVVHVLFPNEPKVDGERWPAVARHGHLCAIIQKLVDMARKELDQLTSAELFPVHCHGELVLASVDDNAIHIFFSLRGPGYLLSRYCSGPRVP